VAITATHKIPILPLSRERRWKKELET